MTWKVVRDDQDEKMGRVVPDEMKPVQELD